RVTFFQLLKNRVAQRFDRRDNEDASQASKCRNHRAMLDYMLDLSREIESDARKLFMHCARNAKTVRWAIQEIKIAERYMPSARPDKTENIFAHNSSGHCEETPVVNGRDRAMSA